MTWPAPLRIAFALSTLAFVSLGLYAYRASIAHGQAASYAHDLRQLTVVDARLNEELLKCRSGLLGHYDTLAASVTELEGLLLRLRQTPRFFDARTASDFHQRLESLARLFAKKNAPLERFKSNNAVLRNSRSFAPVAAERLLSRPGAPAALAEQVGRLLAAILTAATQPDPAVSKSAEAVLAALRVARESVTDRALADELDVLIRHTSVVVARQPVVDSLVLEALSLPFGREASLLGDAYTRAYRDALAAEADREKLLFALAIAMVACGLTDVLLRVRRSALALTRATGELTSANLALAKEREKERELGEMKTRFVAMTSHELRSPLSTVLSSSELLSDYGQRWESERRQQHLARIRDAARDMSQLLDQILLIGTAEAGTLRPTPGPLNLDEHSQDLLEKLANETGRRVVRTLSGDPNVVLDERLLRHLLWNLLDNAAKYSPPEAQVSLGIEVEEHTLRLVVRDAGIGIAAEDLPLLFTSFHRGKNVGQRVGSGLGLSVVKRVVDAQAGAIRVESKLGQGTEFHVELPLEARS
jgi:signal transduction histidine kinase